jgi:hypothetical protein
MLDEKKNTMLKIFAGMVGIAALLLSGCVIYTNESSGPLTTDSRSIDLDKSEKVRVDLRMGAGELRIRGGAQKLVEANFSYNVPNWKPEVRYETSSFGGRLIIQQPEGKGHFGNTKNIWELRFNDGVPLDMSMNLGAGQARLDLGSLTLRNVNIEMGVGQLDLDLRGTPKKDYDVRVHGGVGQANIRLPRDVGVVADAQGGIGGISARGLEKRDGRYFNEAYGKSKVTVRLNVQGGVGQIDLISE